MCALLAGCSSRTDVSATGNVPGQYSHVYITAQAVWFNQSATAGPDDGGWSKFSLSAPVTVDLVAANNGNFLFLMNDLKVTPGTYSQIRLIPVDPTTPLTTSAQTAGASFNCEADYIDSKGVTQQLPLELMNPDKGIGIATSVQVKSNTTNTLGSISSTSTTSRQPKKPARSQRGQPEDSSGSAGAMSTGTATNTIASADRPATAA